MQHYGSCKAGTAVVPVTIKDVASGLAAAVGCICAVHRSPARGRLP